MQHSFLRRARFPQNLAVYSDVSKPRGRVSVDARRRKRQAALRRQDTQTRCESRRNKTRVDSTGENEHPRYCSGTNEEKTGGCSGALRADNAVHAQAGAGASADRDGRPHVNEINSDDDDDKNEKNDSDDNHTIQRQRNHAKQGQEPLSQTANSACIYQPKKMRSSCRQHEPSPPCPPLRKSVHHTEVEVVAFPASVPSRTCHKPCVNVQGRRVRGRLGLTRCFGPYFPTIREREHP